MERKAGMHHEQHHPDMRYYVPMYAKMEKDGTAVLRYRVGASIDSEVADFLRTYDITVKPQRTGPSEGTYVDRCGGVRRTFKVVYDRPAEPDESLDSGARITVSAEPLHTT